MFTNSKEKNVLDDDKLGEMADKIKRFIKQENVELEETHKMLSDEVDKVKKA